MKRLAGVTAVLALALLTGVSVPSARAEPPEGATTAVAAGEEAPVLESRRERRRRLKKPGNREFRKDVLLDQAPDDPPPPGFHREESSLRGLAIGGGASLGGLYLLNVLVAVQAGDQPAPRTTVYPLLLPVIGPFIEAVKTDDRLGRGVSIVDGVVQTVTLGMLVYGLTVHTRILVRDTSIEVVPVPLVVPGGGGVSFGGVF